MKHIALSVGVVAVFSLALPRAFAAPYPMVFQTDDHGDFALIGNVLAHDCRAGVPAPVVGTVGACGNNLTDTGVDVFWRSEQPGAGQAAANTGITVANSRSTAVLNLPVGATVLYARLYWAATLPNNPDTPDGTVTFDRPGGSSVTVTGAGAPFNVTTYGVWVSQTNNYFYQGAADVTAQVTAWGNGTYRIADVNSRTLLNQDNEGTYAGWALVVFYRLASAAYRNLTLFEGFDRAQQGVNVTATLTGFLVPIAGYGGTLGVIAWEGDSGNTGDALSFRGNTLSNALNPADDFFNSTRSTLGAAVSVAGDLPQTTGAASSITGLDLDVVNVTPYLTGGLTTANIVATGSNSDSYAVGAFITSITTYKPLFDTTTKTVVDVNGGTVRPGDVLEYTINTKNTGNDTALETVLTDTIPAALDYVAGSLRITAGANAGNKTDATGDDQGDVVGNLVTVRLGTGANATTGGTMLINDTATIVFRVTYRGDISGVVNNQAYVSASGQSGMPTDTWASDDNGDGSGTPTPIDPDTDGDNVTDSIDNCDFAVNPGQQDTDGDSWGDACDCDSSITTGTTCHTGCAAFYQDADSDSRGNASVSVSRCTAPTGYVADNTDCSDTKAGCWANCGTDTDNDGWCPADGGDCDNALATGATCHNACSTFYQDSDADGRGNLSVTASSCVAPAGYVANSTDCSDTKAGCWANCGTDTDNDGWCPLDGGDCDNALATGASCHNTCSAFYQDSDGDGRGNLSVTVSTCVAPAGYVANSTDCSDTKAGCWANCGTDTDNDGWCPLDGGDCDNALATGASCHNTCSTFYQDSDADGRGNLSVTASTCVVGAGYVANSTDCSDTKAGCWANCGTDTDNDGWCPLDGGDCDNALATGASCHNTCSTFYQDSDADGRGNLSVTASTCVVGTGYVANSSDCSDSKTGCWTNCAEDTDADGWCPSDGGDCDNAATTGPSCHATCLTFYADADGDSQGDAGVSASTCVAPTGYVANSSDCDDTDDLTYDGAAELCDAKDNACIGAIPTDEVDDDGDLYVECSGWSVRAGGTPGLLGGDDCLDTNAFVHPTAVDVCDGYDTSCSSGSSVATDSAETDPDADGYLECAGYVEHGLTKLGGGDCDNGDPTSYPGALELCDGYANDCVSAVPLIEIDNDSDGYVECSGWDDTYHANAAIIAGRDCNDANPAVNPGHAEIACNGTNDDCDPTTLDDPSGIDADHDGYTVGCGPDCDDTNFFVHPTAVENCTDGLDNDCNGLTDRVSGFEDPACAITCNDADGDGYADVACGGSDCNDTNLFINPGAGEHCSDGVDNNCDHLVDVNDPFCPAGCADADLDGYPRATCGGSDCDDTRADIHPGLAEICVDAIDNNCDGRIDGADPQCPAGCADVDLDGYAARTCGGTDCNDSVAAINPAAGELCTDLVDNNCDGRTDGADPLCPSGCDDADGDGYVSVSCGGSDCDDTRATVNPGRRENCRDGVDNNCNGLTDSADAQCPAGCPDDDSDGYEDGTCGGTDCDDGAFFVNPAVGENCVNGIDDNCDGLIDYQDAAQCPAGCADDDGDGYLALSCGGRDCDDAEPGINPGAVENCSDMIDNNCDGVVDGLDPAACPVGCVDGDVDGYPPLICGGSDCNDGDAAIHPGAPELPCDTLDNDCNVLTADAPDLDRDGFVSSTCPPGDDCDDGNPSINPAAGERCIDGIDNNCDGSTDAADPFCSSTCPDADGDGYDSDACGGADCDDGNSNRHPGAGEQCNDGLDNDCDGDVDGADVGDCPPGCVDFDADGYPSAACGGTDCNDWRFDVHPGAGENCGDGADNDCNGLVDNADIASCPAGCVDADGDGYRSTACGGTDCDDASVSTNPGAGEQCTDGADNNCDGRIDNADPLCPSGCVDADGDGYRPTACGGSDCDDALPVVHPGAVERCSNGMDDNCNGLVDDADPACPVGCVDADGDGYRSEACLGQDCDDANRTVFPGAGERCNDGIDNDCNGLVDGEDPQCPAGCADVDGDGYRAASCGGADCNDGSASIRPGAAENCGDGIDNDCDLLIDAADVIDCPVACIANDDDGDGYPDVACGGSDCNDGSSSVNPGMLELSCNGVDDDCNAVTPDDADAVDADLDGFTRGCGQDCDDNDRRVNTGAVERCDDSRDNDCNGLVDAADTAGCPPGCADVDVDGYPDVTCGGSDCDDGDYTVNPGAGENCEDGVDNDCNDLADADDPACTASCPDLDGDGYRALACGGSDCDDDVASTHPGAGEHCTDGVDNDCNGLRDAADVGSCPPGCVDEDGDGYESIACGGSDCNDAAASANPGLVEACDGIDNNCNGLVDEGFEDSDGDDVADCVDIDTDGDGCPDVIDGNPAVASGDADGDGFAADCDCDDAEATLHVDCEKKIWGAAGGCNCSSSGGTLSFVALVPVVVGIRRRRSKAA